VWSVAWFPHMLYWLWPIGVTTRRLEILIRRCITLLAWLWPCGKKVTSLPWCVLMLHGCGHVIKNEGVPWRWMISYMVVAMQNKRRDLILILILMYIIIYMFGVHLCVIILAHPICLCLAMIVYGYTWTNDIAGGTSEV